MQRPSSAMLTAVLRETRPVCGPCDYRPSRTLEVTEHPLARQAGSSDGRSGRSVEDEPDGGQHVGHRLAIPCAPAATRFEQHGADAGRPRPEDIYSVDVLGARAAGIRAVLLDPGGCWGARDCEAVPDVLAAVRLVLDGTTRTTIR